MKNEIFKFIYLIFFLSIYYTGASQPIEKTILFEISSPTNDNVSYLFGTHHAFSKSFFDTLTIVKEKLNASEILIKENLNIPGQGSDDIINNRTTKTKWKKYLKKTDLAYLRGLFKTSATDFEKITPPELNAVLHRYLTIKYCNVRSEDDPDLTLDNYIETLAESQDKEMIGLETIAEQLDILNKDLAGMPPKTFKRRFARLTQLLRFDKPGYSCGVDKEYARMEYDYALDTPCQNAIMLINRNNKWMSILAQNIEQSNCFIAVGLSHLRFECGLIRQLKDFGYSVTPVDVN